VKFYALGIALIWSVVLLGAAHEAASRNVTLGTLTVHRIDVVDREGRLAMVVTNHDDYPPAIVGGKSYPRRGLQAENGIVFYNQGGNEQGALVWDGVRDPRGTYSSSNDLLFDSVETDQLAGLEDANENGATEAGFIGWNEVPLDASMLALIQRAEHLTGAARRVFVAAHPQLSAGFKTRFFFGYDEAGTAQVLLNDAGARPRVKMFVTAGGQARLEFLDARGNVIAEYPNRT
jgi:hypothetical protein